MIDELNRFFIDEDIILSKMDSKIMGLIVSRGIDLKNERLELEKLREELKLRMLYLYNKSVQRTGCGKLVYTDPSDESLGAWQCGQYYDALKNVWICKECGEKNGN